MSQKLTGRELNLCYRVNHDLRPTGERLTILPSDAELIAQILAGDRQRYAVLVKRYERLARAAALRCIHDSHLADDAAQEAFVAAFQGLASLRDRSSFGSWLLGIVRRKAVRVFQQRCRSPAPLSTNESEGLATSEHSSLQSMELLEFVERLPEQERVVIGLRHFDGHSTQDISEITGRPIGTVTKQLSRAHERLRGWITEENSNERNKPDHGPSRSTGAGTS